MSQSPGERRGYPGAHKPLSSLEKWDRGLTDRRAETTDRHVLMPSLTGPALWGGWTQARHHTGGKTGSTASSALVSQTEGAHVYRHAFASFLSEASHDCAEFPAGAPS